MRDEGDADHKKGLAFLNLGCFFLGDLAAHFLVNATKRMGLSHPLCASHYFPLSRAPKRKS